MSYCAILREDGQVTMVVDKNGLESQLFNDILSHPLVTSRNQAVQILKNKFSDTLIGKVTEINEEHYKKVLHNYRQARMGISKDLEAGRITQAQHDAKKKKLDKDLAKAQKNLKIDKKKFDVAPRTKAWDQKTIEALPVSIYDNQNALEEALKGDFGILTGENPMAQQVTDIENFDNNERAKQWLIQKGYNPMPVFGKYGNSEQSFFVPGLTREDAVAFAKEFNQESVAHSDGLVYQDGTYHPRTGEEVGIEAEDFYTIIKLSTGQEVKFKVDYDFDSTLAPTGEAVPGVNKSLINLHKPKISLIFANNSTIVASENAREMRNERDQIQSEAEELQDLINCLW